MPKIIGVKFRNVGKVYYFDPADFKVRYNNHVIVETARGIEYGTVVLTPMELSEEKIASPLKKVIRMATEEDDKTERENRQKEREAYRICKEKIREHQLEMKLIEAEYTFDNSKVLFYFTADGRIDFRELVKDLASVFRTRIELRQIGVRDETKLLGGIGICGRPLCCHTWLTDFQPVSIKMAKDQNLSLNPTKISGVCGRLMCCLNNEADTYAYLNKGMPSKGDQVTLADGRHGEVQSVNILRQSVKVIIELENDEKELAEFGVKELSFISKGKRRKDFQRDGEDKGPKNGGKCACPKKREKLESEEEQIAHAVEAEKEKELDGSSRRDRRDHRNNKKRTNRSEQSFHQGQKTIDLREKTDAAASEAGDGERGAAEDERRPKKRRRRNRHKPNGDAAQKTEVREKE